MVIVADNDCLMDNRKKQNRKKQEGAEIHVGFMPFVYYFYENKEIDLGDGTTVFSYPFSREKLERAYVFSVLLTKNLKNKFVFEYKGKIPHLSQKMGISTRSFNRYLLDMIEIGLCEIQGANLAIFNHKKMLMKVAKNAFGDANLYNRLCTKNSVTLELKENEFNKAKLILRALYIDFQTYINKRVVSKHIKLSQERKFHKGYGSTQDITGTDVFVPYEIRTNGSRVFFGSKKAEDFNSLYKFNFIKHRGYEPIDLSRNFSFSNFSKKYADLMKYGTNVADSHKMSLLELKDSELDMGYDQFVYHRKENKTATDVVVERCRLLSNPHRFDTLVAHQNGNNALAVKCKKMVDAIEWDDDWVEYISSHGGLSAEQKLAITHGKGLGSEQRAINKINMERFTKSSFYMSFGEYNFINNSAILSPDEYYKITCSDYKMEHRLSLNAIANMFNLSKSQCSRMIKSMVEHNIMDHTRRFVYISVADKTLDMDKLELEYAMLTSDVKVNGESNEYIRSNEYRDIDPVLQTPPMFQRLVRKAGCLLYEIEGEKTVRFNYKIKNLDNAVIPKTGFDIYSSLFNENDNKLYINFRYERLAKKVYKDCKTIIYREDVKRHKKLTAKQE